MIQYGMTKTAQLAVARGLAEMTAGSAVTVNVASPRSSGINGAALRVDGGVVRAVG